MPDAPWRCSECGTVNEPVANSCRTCGKWPSLFDLQDSLVEDVEREDARAAAPTASFPADPAVLEPDDYEPETFEQETFEQETFEQETFEQEPFEQEPLEPKLQKTGAYELEDDDEEVGTERSRGRRLASFIVPIAFALYVVISVVFGDR
jgi:hypothetical protein